MPDDPFSYRYEHDSVKATIDLLGDRWIFLVLREAFFGVRRFGQMQRNLGIARTVLADRLKTLVAAGLLERRQYRQEPAWFEYRLTAEGLDFYPVALALMTWGDKHLAGPAGPQPCCGTEPADTPRHPHMFAATAAKPLDPRDIQIEPGPGAPAAAPARPRR